MYDELPGLVFLSLFAVMMNVAPFTFDGTAEVIVNVRSTYCRAFVTMPEVDPQEPPPGQI
jgi:hypothetical protein